MNTYKQAYNISINLVPDRSVTPLYEDIPIIKQPTLKRGVGRPSRNRRREEEEGQKGKKGKMVKYQ